MLNHPEVTADTLSRLRSLDNLNWVLVVCFAFVVYVYLTAIEQKKWNQIAAGLALYAVHWFVEIVNAFLRSRALDSQRRYRVCHSGGSRYRNQHDVLGGRIDSFQVSARRQEHENSWHQ